ncbi:MAG: FHA domain-containing protein [Coprococcus sp.]|nr:FHA domain-containing protein [Coprococcus sp.]
MNLTKCSQGHYYDMDKYVSCPHCSNAAEDAGVTVKYSQSFDTSSLFGNNQTGGSSDMTVQYTEEKEDLGGLVSGISQKSKADDDDTLTIGFGSKAGKVNVVGWLVCIEGEEKGTSFVLKTGRNFIGRNINQDVILAKDRAVSREKHAIILYEPRQKKFIVQPGDSRELFYLNDDVVLGSVNLKPYDSLLIGETKLVFVPFCGDKFNWDDGLIIEEE